MKVEYYVTLSHRMPIDPSKMDPMKIGPFHSVAFIEDTSNTLIYVDINDVGRVCWVYEDDRFGKMEVTVDVVKE